MYLYNLTLLKATEITHAVHGNFFGTGQHEIALAHGKTLELIRPDLKTGKVDILHTFQIFGLIRSMIGFRLTGESKDQLLLEANSGRIVILEYNTLNNSLEKIQEIFEDNDILRLLAIDPMGRALLVSNVANVKSVYILNGDAAGQLTTSSHLEPRGFTYNAVAAGVGFENPVFACIEDYHESAHIEPTADAARERQKVLAFYKLESNRFFCAKYKEIGCLKEHGDLISVPVGNCPGVLICSENYITYQTLGSEPDLYCRIPKRHCDLNDLNRRQSSSIFVCSATYKTETDFFVLAQTEQGDIFKITVEIIEGRVTEIKLKYLDTVPVASAMCVLETDVMFLASKSGNHFLYAITHPEGNNEREFSSAMPLAESHAFLFAPHGLKNLVPILELKNLSPIMQCQIANLANEYTSQLYVACGQGPRSSLRVLRRGSEVLEIKVIDPPSNPIAVWTIKRNSGEEPDEYTILSFVNETWVLSIGETVEHVEDSGFLSTTPTLSCAQVGDDALVQIYPQGIRCIRADKSVNDWQDPDEKTITKCAVNQRHIVIALDGRSLAFFDVGAKGQLHTYPHQKEVHVEVICMVLGSAPSEQQRPSFLAVGFNDDTVHIFSLNHLEGRSETKSYSFLDKPESLAIVETRGGHDALYVNVGFRKGAFLTTKLNQETDDLLETHTVYLGPEPVKLLKVRVRGIDAVVATSSRSWLCYYHQNRFQHTLLSYKTLEYVSEFSSQLCPEGIVAISGSCVLILALGELCPMFYFNQLAIPMEYTPRRFVIHPESRYLIIIEADCDAYTKKTKMIRKHQMVEEMVEEVGEDKRELATEMATVCLGKYRPEVTFKLGSGTWASLIRVLDPIGGKTIYEVSLEPNKVALSICLVKFANQGDQQFLLVGLAKAVDPTNRQCNDNVVQTYKVLDEAELVLIHETKVDEHPAAICAFEGKALIGVGKILRIYDMGEEKLLRKCENRYHFSNEIIAIHAVENRIFVQGEQDSYFFVFYKRSENILTTVATYQHWLTGAFFDCDTVAVADKSGNISVIRLPTDISDAVEKGPTGVESWYDRRWLGGSSQEDEITHIFHVGEQVSSIQKVTSIPGDLQPLVYTTVFGTIGALVPFISEEDHDCLQRLETFIRSGNPHRDHLAYDRSHIASKNAIDGDLCEQFNSFDEHRQREITEHLGRRNPQEVSELLKRLRTSFDF